MQALDVGRGLFRRTRRRFEPWTPHEAMMTRNDRKKGFFVSFDFTSDAITGHLGA